MLPLLLHVLPRGSISLALCCGLVSSKRDLWETDVLAEIIPVLWPVDLLAEARGL